MTGLLLIALVLGSQNSAKSTLDLTGSWRDDSHTQTWTITQNGSDVTMVSGSGIIIRGILDKNVIRYTDQTTLTDASSKACQPYAGQRFDFPSQFRISKNGKKLERKAPPSVTKGQCKLDIRKIPAFVLSRV
jgi:hypothetical protein